MKKNKRVKLIKEDKNYEYLFLLFAVIVFLDRIAKNFLQDGCWMTLCIKRAMNSGAAFGIFPGMTWFFVAIAAIIIISIVMFIDDFNSLCRIALVFIGAGTAANMIDRIFFSSVIDLFSVFGSSSFNLADLSNLAGAILLIIGLVRKK
jgi:lipoprotein signal peptidase